MATYDMTSYFTVKRIGTDLNAGLGLLHVSGSNLPAPVQGDTWQIAKVPGGLLPMAVGVTVVSALATTTAYGSLKFTNKNYFRVDISFHTVGTQNYAFVYGVDNTKSTDSQDSLDFLELYFSSVNGASSNGAFDLFIFYYRI